MAFKWIIFFLIVMITMMSANSQNNKDHFYHIANLFHPSTIDNSFTHDGLGEIEGIKDVNGKWSVMGHKDRIIQVDESLLKIFCELYEGPDSNYLESFEEKNGIDI